MKVITAVEPIINSRGVTAFLAGGITNCPTWQDDVIEMLSDVDGTLFNPRRDNFPIDDPNAAREQIEWEYHALNNADIFTMWFSGGESDQPICMYELGRHLALKPSNRIVIGCDPSYRRAQDVFIQSLLVHRNLVIFYTLEEHAMRIKESVETNYEAIMSRY